MKAGIGILAPSLPSSINKISLESLTLFGDVHTTINKKNTPYYCIALFFIGNDTKWTNEETSDDNKDYENN